MRHRSWMTEQRRAALGMPILVLLIAGWIAWRDIPKEAEPDVRIPIIFVRLTHQGISPEDAERLILEEGEIARISSRRGAVEAPVHIDPSLRPGLAFMTLHFPDQVDTNVLTIDATDPKSGTAEFKAAAIRVEKIEPAEQEEIAAGKVPAGTLVRGS